MYNTFAKVALDYEEAQRGKDRYKDSKYGWDENHYYPELEKVINIGAYARESIKAILDFCEKKFNIKMKDIKSINIEDYVKKNFKKEVNVYSDSYNVFFHDYVNAETLIKCLKYIYNVSARKDFKWKLIFKVNLQEGTFYINFYHYKGKNVTKQASFIFRKNNNVRLDYYLEYYNDCKPLTRENLEELFNMLDAKSESSKRNIIDQLRRAGHPMEI